MPKEARWRERESLAVGRRHHATVVLEAGSQTLLGVFGGFNKGCSLSCELYDVSHDR
ncbi:unnamed protein product [Dibothriocephalus latus]|uniref:Uncharacterized protein n=1 Tax=Dibothriocephalus latus TaxID=60516 RepID=A0A3P7LGN5_DIBLA|nr:unnamed protein product [Dibothriocephalus latus]